MTEPDVRRTPQLSLASFLALAAALAGLVVTTARPGEASPAQQAVNLHCDEVPMGALAPARPIWCEDHVNTGPSTFVQGANSWSDDWEADLNHASLGEGYRVFEAGSVVRTQHFRHGFGLAAGEHWMVDVSGLDAVGVEGPDDWDLGGATMRPDRSFRFENGTLVVEAVVAAGVAEYGGVAWPELVVTTAPEPTGHRADGIYNYDEYAGHYTLGMRLQPNREPIAAFFDNSQRGPGQGGRVFEISHFQNGASSWGEGAQLKWGGHPSIGDLGAAWRVCQGDDPDLFCRDHFRWEIEQDRFTVSVNGVKYMEHAGFPAAQQLPDAFVNGEVYVYFGSWVFKPGRVVRVHWDALRINPESSGPPPTVTPSPVPPTPTPVPPIPPTATPSPTAPAPAATPTATSVPACEIRVRLGGQEQWVRKPAGWCQPEG